jgi:hypothetical protein
MCKSKSLFLRGLSKKYQTLLFPAVNNGERVGKLSAVVEGTIMHMCDFFLPLNTAGCICRFQIAKWCNTCLSHSRFAQDDNAWSSDTASNFVGNLGIPKQKLKSVSTTLKMAACWRTVTSVPGAHQQAEMLMSFI